jgi:hypothetical protein
MRTALALLLALPLKYDLTIDDATNGVPVGIMDETSHATGFARMQIKG